MTDVVTLSQAAQGGAVWPREDLESRVVKALELALAVLDEFGETGFTDPCEPALSFGPDKPVAESAMLAYTAGGATTGGRLAAAVDAVAERLVPLCRSSRALADASLRPQRAFKYAIPHALLTALGYPDERFDEFLVGQCGVARSMAADLPPVAGMERQWVMAKHEPGGGDGARRLDVRGTALERPLDVLTLEREDAYALTHSLFYVSDFGRSPSTSLLRPRASVLDEVRTLLVRYLRLEDYDLSGELLMAWPELAVGWDPVASFCFGVLAEVEDTVGILPCGNLDHRRVAALGAVEARRYTLATAYHTAYVMGFTCAAALRAGSPERHAAPLVQPHHRVWPQLYDLVDHGRGHWQTAFETLGEAEKALLSPMLADMATYDAMESRDYRRAGTVLEAAATAGVEGPLQRRTRAVIATLGRAVELATT